MTDQIPNRNRNSNCTCDFQSNTKLDLTEQLQAERTIGKKLNAQLNEVEQQFDELKEELAKKEAALVEFEKEKLHAAQIEDQIQHYQAQSHSASTLQEELQKALVRQINGIPIMKY